MNRLDCFNVAAVMVLHRLLEMFPQPVVLDAEILQAELVDLHSICDIKGGPGNPGNLLRWTIQFLVDEGYVRTNGPAGQITAKCVLTAKGFAALNRKLEALAPTASLGTRLLEVGKLVAPEMASVLVGGFLS